MCIDKHIGRVVLCRHIKICKVLLMIGGERTMYALFIRDRWVDAPDCKVNLCSDRFWISGILESNKKIFAVPDSAD